MQSIVAHRRSQTAESKGKSGCLTCRYDKPRDSYLTEAEETHAAFVRTRRVKCDKNFPVCSRCVSSSRVCQGYGIWGGGGNVNAERGRKCQITPNDKHESVTPLACSISPMATSLEEKEYFDWFKCRTSVKLPGSFVSDFWTTLLLQGSFGEPAILHAVLALTSVHRRGILLHHGTNSVPDKQMEQFTLQHYSKAIHNLRPHFLTKDRASFRVVLISCLVFSSLDLLRGHFVSAQLHLQNGLKLLGEMRWSSSGSHSIIASRPAREAIDDWIVEVFMRLQVHAELFGHLFLGSCPPIQQAQNRPPKPHFLSLTDAWNEIDRILRRILNLTEQARDLKKDSSSSELSSSQHRLQTDLVRWLGTYEASREILRGLDEIDERKAYLLLSICHTMATIMAEVCLSPEDEMAYDAHTDRFVALIKQLADIRASIPLYQNSSRHRINMSRSIIDIGWIPPLYYIAIKCRVHRIRLQAVRLLEVTFHREGMWDSQIAGVVARRIMEIEERDFYQGMDVDAEFLTSSYPEPSDLSLPLLPTCHRIPRVEVVLLGEPLEKVVLLCEQKIGGQQSKICLGQYHVELERWVGA
jgi:hypothetical protein